MNYYRPRELKNQEGLPTGLWYFTVRNDDRIWPTGYCATGCAGHATPDEAREHYRQYLLDTADFKGKLLNTQHRCKVCGTYTSTFASVGPGPIEIYMLCADHLNRESLAPFVQANDAASSW